MKTADIMDIFATANLLRPVHTQPIVVEGVGVIPDRKAIVFSDTNKYIAIVGANYNVVQNEEIYTTMAKALVKSKLKLDGLMVRASNSGNYARSLVEIKFPEYQVEVGNGDFTQLSTVMRNSYDGSWKHQLDTGGFRMVCANGQVIGDFQSIFAKRHISNFSMPDMATYLINSVENFADMGKRWVAMTGQPLTEAQAIDLLLSFIGRSTDDEEQKLQWLDSKRARNVQAIVAGWRENSHSLGSNMWALYNTMTAHATHVGELASPADVRSYRDKQVSRVLNEAELLLAA